MKSQMENHLDLGLASPTANDHRGYWRLHKGPTSTPVPRLLGRNGKRSNGEYAQRNAST